MINKVIFLDIDGVLNHQQFYEYRKDNPEKFKELVYPLNQIDPKCVEYLNMLIEDTGAKIVVSSTWRINHTKEELQNILGYHGFKGEIIDVTPNLSYEGYVRGNEIKAWIDKNINYEDKDNFRYVILDDDSDMLLWQQHNFICVDYFIGITPKTIYKATQILNK